MTGIVTLPERKRDEAARRARSATALLPVLTAYARDHGGRFLLYGSAARGQMRFDSDVDILLDFPDATQTDAWSFAETACWDLGLEPDLLPFGWCKPDFLDHIAPDLRVLA